MKRSFFLDDPRLLRARDGLLMSLDDVYAFDDQAITARHVLPHTTPCSLIFPGDYDDIVAGNNLLCHFSSVPWSLLQYFRRQGHNPHILSVAELSSHRAENARPSRVSLRVDQDRGI